MSSLTIVCPNARRCKVPVNPGKQLREVLEEACLMQGYDADSHELQHHGRIIDETLTFRLSGLPNNASLDLVPSTRKSGVEDVELALQTSDGRKTASFTSMTSLSSVLEQFSEQFNQNLLNPGENQTAVITYLNKQWKGLPILESTTLKSMGIYSGRALLRYSAVSLTEEEKVELAQALVAAEERKLKLVQKFEKQKADNAARAELEAKYQKEFEERQKVLEEERIKFEQELFQKEQEAREKEKQRKIEAEKSKVTSNPASDAGSSSTTVPRQTASEIERLEATLRILNASLQSGRSDSLVEHLLTESGTLRTDVEMEEITLAANTPSKPPPVDFSNFKFPEHKIKVDYDTGEDDKIVEEIKFEPPSDRQVLFFERMLNEEKKKELEEIDDEADEVTIKDVKMRYRELKQEVDNQRAFVPKRFIDEQNRKRKRDAYKNTVIRFLLSENKTIQACFYSQESTESIYNFMDSILTTSDIKYDLVFYLKEKVPKDCYKNLIDAGIAPKSNIIMIFDPKLTNDELDGLFNKEMLKITNMEEANVISNEWLKVNSKFEPYIPTIGSESQTVQNKRRNEVMDDDEHAGPPPQRKNLDGMPKWLKR